MSNQSHAVYHQEVQSGSRSVRACMVVVEQQTFGSTPLAACTPLLQDVGQALVDTPVGEDRLPVLERCGG